MFIDESGRDTYPGPKSKRKDKLFVELGIVFSDDEDVERTYDEVLELKIPGTDVRLRELMELQRRLGGSSCELRAGYILNLEGPFSLLRPLPKERLGDIKESLIAGIVKRVVRGSRYVIASIVDKDDLKELSTRVGTALDIRLFAIEALLTRIARTCERLYEEAVVIHDNIRGREREIKDMLKELKIKGYFYNPRLKHRPKYSLIDRIEFRDSKKCKAIQLADILANTVLRYRAGTGAIDAYRTLATSTKYIEFMYRKRS